MDSIRKIVTHIQEANHNAERAYWWMKNIDCEEAKTLEISNKVQTVLDLLQQVDNITIDIVITIKQKTN